MNHDLAISVFEEIRNRPYAWSVQKDVHANNCYFKGIEVLQRLGSFGYAVRGCVGETYNRLIMIYFFEYRTPFGKLFDHFLVRT